MTERKIWKDLTPEEQKVEIERLLHERLALTPERFMNHLRFFQMVKEAQEMFSPVVVDGKGPGPAPNRYDDYKEMDQYLLLLSGPYSEDAEAASE